MYLTYYIEHCRKIQDKKIFPQTFTLQNILLALSVGNATVERSFSQMKTVKAKLRNRLFECNLSRPLKMAIEGQEPSGLPFQEILDVFNERPRRIDL